MRRQLGFLIVILSISVSCSQRKVYEINNGLLELEIEDLDPDFFARGKWQIDTTFSGYSGRGYAIWKGDAIWGNDSQPDNNPQRHIKFSINVTEPGTYYIKLRNYHLKHDGDNDVFIRTSGWKDGNFAKYYDSDEKAWTLDETSYWAAQQFEKGRNTIELAGRSHGFAIDKIIIYKEGKVLPQTPVNPSASTEAKRLLSYLYEVKKNNGILSGMHNDLDKPTKWDNSLLNYNNNVQPALWGSDFRYGDHVPHRQRMIDEAIRQHKEKGKIITLMYHQVRPMDDEKCCYDDIWKQSIQGNISEVEFDSLITKGTQIHEMWRTKWDTVATYLQQLEDKKIPVLFRPYHEMNGGWFWWGEWAGYPTEEGEEPDRTKNRFIKLYKMTYHYLTDEKKLDNLLWVLNYDDHSNDLHLFYPGDNYVDVIATDVYHNAYTLEHYEALRHIAGEKPLALGEVGSLPPLDTLRNTYPDFVWFMGWRKLFFQEFNDQNDGQSKEVILKLFQEDYILNAEDLKQ